MIHHREHFERKPINYKYPNNIWLAVIHTIPSRINRSINTRNTWCQKKYQERYGFKCIFVYVKSTVERDGANDQLMSLNETYHDIYYIEMPGLKEGWFTMQQKNIDGFIFALDAFPNYQYYCRVDDEIVVSVDEVSEFLLSLKETNVVLGRLYSHAPGLTVGAKYYDPLASCLRRYYTFPSGCFSIFSKNITKFLASWDNYYRIAPSSLEDPGMGNFIYKYAQTEKVKVHLYQTIDWGYRFYHVDVGTLGQLEGWKKLLNSNERLRI